jgi:hypothetical protein
VPLAKNPFEISDDDDDDDYYYYYNHHHHNNDIISGLVSSIVILLISYYLFNLQALNGHENVHVQEHITRIHSGLVERKKKWESERTGNTCIQH